MPDDQYYIQVKEEAERWLFKIPGVRAVGLGPKLVGGCAIGKLAIQVFVESKRPRVSLNSEEVIPEFIKEIPTDVWEWHRPVSTQGEITVDDCPTGVIQNVTPKNTGTTLTHLEILSPAHGLFDNARVRITVREPDQLTSLSYLVAVKNDNEFIIPVMENGLDVSPVKIPYVANSARWINVSTFDNLCCCPSGEITFVGVSTIVSIGSIAHGLLNGDRIKIRKAPLLLHPQIFEVKKVDEDNFDLVGANPSDFGGISTGWRWRKVSMARAGRITTIEMTNPIVIHSAGHGLSNNDTIIIQTIQNVTIANLDNHVRQDRRKIPPYRVAISDPDKFTLPEVNATAWGSPNITADFIGSWIKVIDDRKKYGRNWGGIRLEMKQSETTTVEAAPETRPASPMRPDSDRGGQIIHTEVKLNTGTLGCIATDNLTGKKVLLSNSHVIYSGTDNDEVHHPDFYTSSRSCSKHKIARRIRHVFGRDPEHPNITVDAAIAIFEPDERKHDPFIVDIGFVKDVADIAPSELLNNDYRVWKRGAQTGITEGIVTSANHSFFSEEDQLQWQNQLQIQAIAGDFRGFMSILGDSGSVLVNKDNKVVGLLHKATHTGGAIANRILDVETAMKIKIWKEGDPLAAGEDPIVPGPQVATSGIPALFASTIAELSATEAGNNLAVIVQSHVPEVMSLMETNKKFATIWHRNHGPELMQRLREGIEARNRSMPALVEGRPFPEVLIDLLESLKRFGSPRLAAHVKQYEELVMQLLNYTYEDLLRLLRQNPQLVAKT